MKELAEKLLKLITETQDQYVKMVEMSEKASKLTTDNLAEAERLAQKDKSLASKEAALGGLASLTEREDQVRAKDRQLTSKSNDLDIKERELAKKEADLKEFANEVQKSKELYAAKNVRLDEEMAKLKKDRENMRIDLLKELSSKI